MNVGAENVLARGTRTEPTPAKSILAAASNNCAAADFGASDARKSPTTLGTIVLAELVVVGDVAARVTLCTSRSRNHNCFAMSSGDCFRMKPKQAAVAARTMASERGR